MNQDATRGRARLTAGLFVALVIAATAAGVCTWLGARAEGPQSAQQAALEAARTRVPVMLSYDVATLSADLDRAIDQTTGDFREDYAEILRTSVEPLAGKRGISTTAHVVGAGVVDGDDERVTVLMLLNQVTTGRKGEPSALGSRIEVEMVADGDTWRIAGYTPV